MNYVYTKLIPVLALVLLSACAPKPFGLTWDPQGSHDPDFVKGYHEGCESGLAAFGNSYYKTFYHFKKSFDAKNDALYQNGWEKGYQYCRQYAMKWTHTPFK